MLDTEQSHNIPLGLILIVPPFTCGTIACSGVNADTPEVTEALCALPAYVPTRALRRFQDGIPRHPHPATFPSPMLTHPLMGFQISPSSPEQMTSLTKWITPGGFCVRCSPPLNHSQGRFLKLMAPGSGDAPQPHRLCCHISSQEAQKQKP